ncbi:hypothetical protein [Streptomyces sp. NPDC048282]|uniref:hypothetical protein n=1 Tax=Streptomyces sp. NPDC048282 TaxID=3365528 RepID=UPI003716332D
MQSEVVVTLISTLGTVGVAFLTVRGIERKDDRPYIKPLMELGKFCGHATGVAQAAVTECEEVFRQLAENDQSDHVPSAERRMSAFRTEARLDDHALVGAEAYDFVRSELDTYVQATRALQRKLEAAGRAIDGLAAVRPLSRGRRARSRSASARPAGVSGRVGHGVREQRRRLLPSVRLLHVHASAAHSPEARGKPVRSFCLVRTEDSIRTSGR